MAGKINAADLTAAQRRALLGKTKDRFDKEAVRKRAIDMLATITDLAQQDRSRVLKQALKLNEV